MKRPAMVTIIGVLLVLAGLAQMALGGVMLAGRNDAKFLADANATSSTVTGIGIGLLLVGALSVLLSIGLFKGSRVSRDFIGVLEAGQVGVAVYTIVALDTAQRSGAVGSIVGALIVLFFLFGTDKAKNYFAKA
jgi:hypothetical protein